MTTEAKKGEFEGHTAGPWKATRALRASDGEYDWGIGAQIEGQKYCIAEAFGRVDTEVRPNAEANAHMAEVERIMTKLMDQGMSEDEAYDRASDLAYDAMCDRLADMADEARMRAKEGRK